MYKVWWNDYVLRMAYIIWNMHGGFALICWGDIISSQWFHAIRIGLAIYVRTTPVTREYVSCWYHNSYFGYGNGIERPIFENHTHNYANRPSHAYVKISYTISWLYDI